MLVVSDTSVLINLATIGEVAILQRLFLQVVAPEAVHAEFVRLASTEARFHSAIWPAWVEVRRPLSIPSDLLTWPRPLHAGECEAIALAIEIHADALLVDEEAARSAARAHGLNVTGIAGILLRAKTSGEILSVAPVLDRLMADAGFWFGSALRREVLLLAGENPGV